VKKKILKLVLATSVLTAVVSVGTVSAASTTKAPTAPAYVKTSLNFNGMNIDLRTVEVNKVKLVALRDLTDALGASLEINDGIITLQLVNALELKENSTTYTVNGVTMNYTTAPINVGGSLFVELATTVDALGGSVETNASGISTYRSFKLLEGNFSAPYWISGNKVIAVKDGESKSIYKLDPQSLSSELYSNNEDALDLKVSPDGQYGIYTNIDAQLMLMTLNPGIISSLSLDKTLKTDLTWTADSKKVYFAQGDNQDKISYIDFATATIKTVLDDKINFKSDLHLSPDGTKLLYNQNVTGTADVKAPSSSDDLAASEATLTVDFSKAGAQLFSLDLATAGAKPVKLTDGKVNTFDASILNDGSTVYVNADPADAAAKGTLKQVSPAGVVKDLVTDIDVNSSVATAAGTFIITGTDAAGKTHLATVTADGKKTELLTTDVDVTHISSSTDGTSIFATIGGKLAVIKNGNISYLTK
jgi:hypothetical protein